MNSGEKVAMRNYFESLPVYSEYFDEAIDAIIAAMDSGIRAEKGRVLLELGATNKDFWFLKDGFLKEMYRSPYSNEDSLFNMIPPSSIFVNEDTLFANRRPQHYFVAYTSVEILRLKEAEYQKLLQQYPILINLLYISGTAEIQRGRTRKVKYVADEQNAGSYSLGATTSTRIVPNHGQNDTCAIRWREQGKLIQGIRKE